jgi:N-acetyl-D-muramate 6-phosphate phosphatase
MTPRIARAVLFDLDGTLLDTAADLCAAANAVLREEGRAPLAVETLRPAVSRGSRAMLAVAFPELDAATREPLVARFLAAYARDIASHSRLFDGMETVLQAIEAAGSRWGIVTNKPEYLARALVEALGLDARCAVLIGGDTLPVRKPDPEPLRVACRRIAVDVSDAVYVGDDERDVQAANAAPMKSIAAAWGYRDAGERIETWGADLVLPSPGDLLHHLHPRV